MNKQEIEKAIKTLKDRISYYEQLIEYVVSDQMENDYKEEIEVCNTAIEALYQQLTGGWIPVSERLPEDRHYPPVICCHTSDNWTDAAIVTDAGVFINSEGCEIYPTHWKPLPEPYKEGTQ